MQRLCEMTSFAPAFALAFLALAGGGFAEAAPGSIKTKVSSLSAQGEARVGLDLPSEKVSRTATTLSALSPTFWGDRASVRAAVTSAKNDYKNVTLRSRDGAQRNLGQSFDGMETSAEIGADISEGEHRANIGHSRMLSASPYPFQAWTGGYSYGFFRGATVVGTNYSSARQKQPFNLVIDPRNFRPKARPQSLTSQKIDLFAEQLLTERWKVHGKIFQGARFEDRPKHYGAELKNAYALSDRWYLRLDTGALRERRAETLKDERGYFDVYWAEAQATFEPVYDLLLSAAYGMTVEREDIPWEQAIRQVGADHYSLRASYRSRSWNAAVSGTATNTNTNYRTRGIVGELTWEI